MTRLNALRASGLVAFAGLIFLGIDEPAGVARGWLAALVFWSTVAIGNLVLLMVHRLTGGRWGDAAGGSMDAGAAGVPLLFIAIVPVFLAAGVLYPWQDAASPPIDAAVAHIYLNLPLFAARSVVALAGWTAIWIGLRRLHGHQGVLLAALGLVFHGIAISLISVDWVLSAQPKFTSSAFGATIAISQCLAGFAWIALWTDGTDERLAGDLAGLLIAGILGLVYMEFISFTVIWYGDLPAKITWYLDRADGWAWLIIGAFLVGAVLPLALLLGRRLVGDPRGIRAVRAAAICVLAGIAVYDIWLVVPQSGAEALAPAVLAIIALGGLWLGFAPARMRIAHA